MSWLKRTGKNSGIITLNLSQNPGNNAPAASDSGITTLNPDHNPENNVLPALFIRAALQAGGPLEYNGASQDMITAYKNYRRFPTPPIPSNPHATGFDNYTFTTTSDGGIKVEIKISGDYVTTDHEKLFKEKVRKDDAETTKLLKDLGFHVGKLGKEDIETHWRESVIYGRSKPTVYDAKTHQLNDGAQKEILETFSTRFEEAPKADFSKPDVVTLTFSRALVARIAEAASKEGKEKTFQFGFAPLMNYPITIDSQVFSSHVDESKPRDYAEPRGGIGFI